MALVLKDRVKESATTTGTGTVTLAGAYSGYRTFASCVPTGSVVYYCIHNTSAGYESEWEVGYGTFTLSGTTLSRTAVYSSSNAGSLVNFSAGTKEVFLTYPADQAVYQETDGTVAISVTGSSGSCTGNAATATSATTATTANATAATLTRGSYLTGSNFNGSAATTWAVNATNVNTASTVVARDASGNFSAGTITATLSGNASTATSATTATTATTANATAATLTRGSYLTGSNFNGSAATTWAVDATNVNTGSTVVARDASGNFSAGTITATLSGNASTATSATSATTATTATTFTSTTQNSQFASIGVGTPASGTSGEIRATNNVTAYYSDDRLKTRLGVIDNALDKVGRLTGFFYEANDVAQGFGYEVKREVGLSAQDVEKVLPEVVAPAPIDDRYLTLRYERIVPLLVEAIKELRAEVDALKGQ